MTHSDAIQIAVEALKDIAYAKSYTVREYPFELVKIALKALTALRQSPQPGAVEPMTEKEEAIKLANKILDRISADPDDDLALLSRQFLRALEVSPSPVPAKAGPMKSAEEWVEYIDRHATSAYMFDEKEALPIIRRIQSDAIASASGGRVERELPECPECGVNKAEVILKLCPGCQAYKDHQA